MKALAQDLCPHLYAFSPLLLIIVEGKFGREEGRFIDVPLRLADAASIARSSAETGGLSSPALSTTVALSFNALSLEFEKAAVSETKRTVSCGDDELKKTK